MIDQPSISSFLRAMRSRWLNAMSGAASVPFAVAAVLIGGEYERVMLGIAAFTCLAISAYQTWRVERERVLELGKISKSDLQNMLGGMYVGDVFIYGAEGIICKQYQTPLDFNALRRGYDAVSVRAPGRSSAIIRFQFLNGHALSESAVFYVKDGSGNECRIDNIYDKVDVQLDHGSSFGLKIDPDSKLSEAASLWVFVDGWRK